MHSLSSIHLNLRRGEHLQIIYTLKMGNCNQSGSRSLARSLEDNCGPNRRRRKRGNNNQNGSSSSSSIQASPVANQTKPANKTTTLNQLAAKQEIKKPEEDSSVAKEAAVVAAAAASEAPNQISSNADKENEMQIKLAKLKGKSEWK